MKDFNDLDWKKKARMLYELHPIQTWHIKTQALLSSLRSSSSDLLVACSGGADSTFSLLLLYSLFEEKCRVIHTNHQKRGIESDRDEEFVCLLSEQLGLAIDCCRLDSKVGNDEGSLHSARLNHFMDCMKRLEITNLFQGHNLDDVAETILWRISRGSGVEGLCAPKPVSRHGDFFFLRPFLTISSVQIRNSMQKLEIPYQTDHSNFSFKHLRNRIRTNTLPRWKQDVDRDLLRGVEETRNQLEETDEALDFIADSVKQDVIHGSEVRVRVLREIPVAIRRRLLSRWISENGFMLSRRNMNLLLNSIQERKRVTINLTNEITLRNNLEILEVIRSSPISIWPEGSFFLPLCGLLQLPNGHQLIATTFLKSIDWKRIQGADPREEAWIDFDSVIEKGLNVRRRKPGDCYQPIGSKGRKKLKDWFIDRKWDKAKKETTPLVTDSKDRIIWVPGFAPSETSMIRQSSKRVIHLTYRLSATKYVL